MFVAGARLVEHHQDAVVDRRVAAPATTAGAQAKSRGRGWVGGGRRALPRRKGPARRPQPAPRRREFQRQRQAPPARPRRVGGALALLLPRRAAAAGRRPMSIAWTPDSGDDRGLRPRDRARDRCSSATSRWRRRNRAAAAASLAAASRFAASRRSCRPRAAIATASCLASARDNASSRWNGAGGVSKTLTGLAARCSSCVNDATALMMRRTNSTQWWLFFGSCKDAATLSCALKNQFNSGFDNTQQLFSWRRSPLTEHNITTPSTNPDSVRLLGTPPFTQQIAERRLRTRRGLRPDEALQTAARRAQASRTWGGTWRWRDNAAIP